jgi:hypothetical protein
MCIMPFFNGLGATALGYLMQGATKFGARASAPPPRPHLLSLPRSDGSPRLQPAARRLARGAAAPMP